MSRPGYLYNIYDNGEKVMSEVTASEVESLIGMHISNVKKYAEEGTIYHKRYRVELIEKSLLKQQYGIDPEEWDRAMMEFNERHREHLKKVFVPKKK